MIVVVGEALVDRVVAADGTTVDTPGGAPFNVARACGRLGAVVALAASISTDEYGRRLVDVLVGDTVDASLVQRTPRPTTIAHARLDTAGVARYRFDVDGTAAPALTAFDLPRQTRALFTGGLGLVLEPMAKVVEATVIGSPVDTLVVLDLNCRPEVIVDRSAYVHRVERVLTRADVVKVSDEDLAYLYPGLDPLTAARRMLGRVPGVVLVTAGGEPTTVIDRRAERVVDVNPTPVVDTIGAGDSFAAGFLTWWVQSGRGRAELVDLAALVRAAEAGHEVAAIVVGRRGADPPWRQELRADWASGPT